MISSVRVVIKDSGMPVSGMAGTAGLTEGCRWNNAAAGYAGHPDGPGRSNVIQGHVRVGQGSRRNPLLDGIHAGLRQAKAPGTESPVGMRFAILMDPDAAYRAASGSDRAPGETRFWMASMPRQQLPAPVGMRFAITDRLPPPTAAQSRGACRGQLASVAHGCQSTVPQ